MSLPLVSKGVLAVHVGRTLGGVAGTLRGALDDDEARDVTVAVGDLCIALGGLGLRMTREANAEALACAAGLVDRLLDGSGCGRRGGDRSTGNLVISVLCILEGPGIGNGLLLLLDGRGLL
jgi:hypothetical protein